MKTKPYKNCQIKTASWQQDKETLQCIRKKVFIEEQHIPKELEWDEDDDRATHFLVSIEGEPIATARLKGDGQIGRMAVLHDFRHSNIGSQLLIFILKTAQSRSIRPVFLNAQIQVIGFYKKHGFKEEGVTFMDANIPHRRMVREK